MQLPFDFKAFMTVINQYIHSKTDMIAISQGTQGAELPYPFFTYENITPHIDLGFTDNVNFELFEFIIEFDAHCLDVPPTSDSEDKPPFGANGASNLANYLSKLFLTDEFNQLGEQNGFTVVGNPGNVNSTTNLISMQVERSAGFQVRFRVRDSFSENIEYITHP